MDNKGTKLLGDLVIARTYSNIKKDGKPERWDEIVDRYLDMMKYKYPNLSNDINKYGKLIYDKKVVGSMRGKQFAGKPILDNNARLYNCCTMVLKDFQSFAEFVFLLMCGSGVGYSVETRYTEQLPVIKTGNEVTISVPDDKEGWSDSVRQLLENPNTKFDYSLVRPAGAKLSSGGNASGPEPLKQSHDIIRKILLNAVGRKLKPIEVFDIACHCADFVISGGVRRSATICFFDAEDEEMLQSKQGNWYEENPQRQMANISQAIYRNISKEVFDRVITKTLESLSGEPGIAWMTYEDEKYQLLGNPCFEISLRAFSFCNLSEFIIPRLKTFEEYKEAAEAATFFGTLQAGFTDFKYLRPIWKQNTEMDALLGVSMTGQAQAWDQPWFNSESKHEVAKHCVSVNKKYAKIIGINPAKRVTTTKPSGSTSAAMGNSSGVHAEWPFVLRKILIDKKSNLGKYLKEKLELDKIILNKNNNLMEQSLAKENCWVLNLPLKYENTIDKDKESAVEFLNRVKDTHDSWITGGHVEGLESHNCSATCYYHEHEIEDIKKWLWENKDSYRGMAFFRHGDYQMIEMPFTKITKDQYEEMSSNIPDVDVFDVVLEEINKGETVACAGGSCEIKSL